MGGGKNTERSRKIVQYCKLGEIYNKNRFTCLRMVPKFYFTIHPWENEQFRKNILGSINHCNNFQFADEECICVWRWRNLQHIVLYTLLQNQINAARVWENPIGPK